MPAADPRSSAPEQRRAVGYGAHPVVGGPDGSTLDRATAMPPGAAHPRLDELGIDLAFLYPTFGLT